MLRRPAAPGAAQLRVAVLTSRRAPGIDRLLDVSQRGRAPYHVVGCVATDPAFAQRARLEAAGVPLALQDVAAFHRDRGARLADMQVRAACDAVTLATLAGWSPDVLVLCGYLFILSGEALRAYPTRILNIHDGDLTRLDAFGRPRYRGLHATRDAILAGEPETRSTIHIVTEEVDIGPLVARSWSFPVHPLVEDARRWQAMDILKAYAYAQREWMMRAAWGPLLDRALRRLAMGELRLLDGRAIVARSIGMRREA
jgi:phosphoribosylglycinamide formyltransferase 1